VYDRFQRGDLPGWKVIGIKLSIDSHHQRS